MSNGNGHRWSKFWWCDWQNDKALQSCSIAARGLWIELLGIAHQSDRPGYVLVNGQAPDPRELADMLGNITQREVVKLLDELERKRVFSRNQDGIIFSRRMVKDAALSDAGRESAEKRWGTKTDPHPNGSPNGSPNGKANGFPIRDPIAKKLEADTESEEEEERKKDTKLTSFSSTMRARPEPPGDALSALMSDAGIEKPERIDRSSDEPASSDPVILATIRKAARACAMRVPYGEVRSVEAQIAALEQQPAAVGAEMTMGLRWQPAAPVRTPAEQLAALLGISLAEAETRVPAAAA